MVSKLSGVDNQHYSSQLGAERSSVCLLGLWCLMISLAIQGVSCDHITLCGMSSSSGRSAAIRGQAIDEIKEHLKDGCWEPRSLPVLSEPDLPGWDMGV